MRVTFQFHEFVPEGATHFTYIEYEREPSTVEWYKFDGEDWYFCFWSSPGQMKWVVCGHVPLAAYLKPILPVNEV